MCQLCLSARAFPGLCAGVNPPAPPCSVFTSLRYNTETVSADVLSRMKQQMTDVNSSGSSHSFLLDDDATLPFAASDVLNAMDDKVRE